jgi:hypothetical protein
MAKKSAKTNLIVTTPKSGVMTPNSLQRMVDMEVASRKILTAFISDHMKDGVDYGRIHISKNCDNKYTCTYKQHPGHWSKPSLFKPGAEKFQSLMKLRAEYKKDTETYEMAGSNAGLFTYVCYLKDPKNRTVGEGRGAASVGATTDVNKAIKMAEKRAKVDAVLSTGGLSDFFTQDLEDGGVVDDLTPKTPVKGPVKTQGGTVTTPPKTIPMSKTQHDFIMQLLGDKGKTVEDLENVCKKVFGCNFAALNIAQASQIITRLQRIPNVVSESDVTDEDINKIDQAISGGAQA